MFEVVFKWFKFMRVRLMFSDVVHRVRRYLMPRRCKVCDSPHRAEYERLYLEERLPITDVYKIAVHKYGETFSYDALRRHMRNHVDFYMELRKRIDKERKELYSRVLRQDIMVAEQLLENLKICQQKIESLAKKQQITPKDEQILLKWLGEARLTIEEILKWKDKIQWEEPKGSEEMIDVILRIIADFPEEYQIMFKERWEQYVREREDSA